VLLQLCPSHSHFPSGETQLRPSKITNHITLGRTASILLTPVTAFRGVLIDVMGKAAKKAIWG
jgi:hypothetical protein